MDLDCYVFSESYLLNLQYNEPAGELILLIEAYIGLDHPGAADLAFIDDEDGFEKYYRTVQLHFRGVQDYKCRQSQPALNDSGPDHGQIQTLEIEDRDEEGPAPPYQICRFQSQYIDFQAGFDYYQLAEI